MNKFTYGRGEPAMAVGFGCLFALLTGVTTLVLGIVFYLVR